MILYKYLSPERVDVLEHRRIRYSQPNAFNDPFEVKPYISHISDDAQIEANIDQLLDDETRKLYEILPPEACAILSYEQIASLVMQRRESLRGRFGILINKFTPKVREIMENKFNEILGILSLSESPTNILMWSHYARHHEGFVIGFDVTHNHFNEKRSEKDEFGYARKVEYRPKRPNAALSAMDGVDVFLVKAADWSYEREWRVFRPLPNAGQRIETGGIPICLFSFPPECVVEVIIGARTNTNERSSLVNLATILSRTQSLHVYNAKLSDAEFKIKLEEIAI
jgi:hypothetical protein